MAALGWWRLEMAAPAELEESLLWKLPQLGIQRLAIRSIPAEPSAHLLVAWVPEIDWPEAERARLAGALAPLADTFALPLPPLAWFHQSDEDWSLSWKQHWQPDPVGERFLILPAWLERPEEHRERLVIRLDPGSAFGTGSHPTTRLCLEALEGLARGRGGTLAGLRVADLGCGSGILGLGALRLGANSLAASDTDPLAVRATGENAALNGLDQAGELAAHREGALPRLQVAQGSVEELAELLQGRPADLLLCNILAPVIEALAPRFSAVLAADGVGYLSGLLLEQVEGLQRALAAEGWRAEQVGSQGPWGLLELRATGAQTSNVS
ncbi:50S ribosomal protein L11 methyltransferase [Cyanobium sp. Morenito 9A2]|uniref:50S ribosomal protein L11 methyltransferase n=1 Tax=Cyanobium sp. Morenito 9A2 TaxID=2823718 RepID=UPI0020CDA589|nr:50S ribosomal protein L11 methyltransferase [Cyanobium sp. Morenito 9A2]MCP9849104.1 50S ribosomal protein L11 methyltransferase [Cyanobium sp. Morenito 9A2]